LQLKDAMVEILDDFRDVDYLNIITFESNSHLWIPKGFSKDGTFHAHRATKELKAEAIEFCLTLNANGGTNLYPAILLAFEQIEAVKKVVSENAKKLVIFLTDGHVYSSQSAIDRFERENRINRKVLLTFWFIFRIRNFMVNKL
jgi:hypothetical protein